MNTLIIFSLKFSAIIILVIYCVSFAIILAVLVIGIVKKIAKSQMKYEKQYNDLYFKIDEEIHKSKPDKKLVWKNIKDLNDLKYKDDRKTRELTFGFLRDFYGITCEGEEKLEIIPELQ